jgi:hypothetical protein
MSQQHQASRRRTYGRRLHEMKQLPEPAERRFGYLSQIELEPMGEADRRAVSARFEFPTGSYNLAAGGVD